MTTNEHYLVITVLARQYQYVKTLIQILKSRGVLETDDFRAFQSLVVLDEASNDALLHRATEEYLTLAQNLGVDTGIET